MSTEYFIEYEKVTIEDKNYKPNDFPNSWFVQQPIDEEHKHWKLLAFLQRVDENVKNGYLFQEYDTVEKRYKDLESFVSTYEIVNKNKESEKLFNYIYELPSSAKELKVVDMVVKNSLKQLKQKFMELALAITYLKDNILIVRKEIRDGRKNLHVYIEMCNCSIIEHYTISKKGNIDYLGSFPLKTPFVSDLENNFIEVKTNISLNSKGVILPYLIRFNLSKS